MLILLWIAVSLDMDVDTDKELTAHGYSNILAGVIGTVYALYFTFPLQTFDFVEHFRPNYLVYVNTLL